MMGSNENMWCCDEEVGHFWQRIGIVFGVEMLGFKEVGFDEDWKTQIPNEEKKNFVEN